MKMNKNILLIFLAFLSLAAASQKSADSTKVIARDVIIKTNGNLFQCQVVEVNDSLIIFKLPAPAKPAQLNNVPRGEVYAVSYGNGPAMVITPELMGKKADIYPKNECVAWETFKKNLGSGSVNIGIGFINFYSPIKDWKSYEDNNVMPSIFAGYTFRISKVLKAGVHIGLGGNDLSKSGESAYDKVKISSTIDQRFFNLGLYCRYDPLKGAFRPYVKGGFDFFGVNMVTTSEATSLDGSEQSLKTVVHQSGIKPGIILRGGMELLFGNVFGIYGDAGTGLSLVQVGVVFNFE
jgi:hypothetical protein